MRLSHSTTGTWDVNPILFETQVAALTTDFPKPSITPKPQVKAGLSPPPWGRWERTQVGPSSSLGHSLGASEAEGMLTLALTTANTRSPGPKDAQPNASHKRLGLRQKPGGDQRKTSEGGQVSVLSTLMSHQGNAHLPPSQPQVADALPSLGQVSSVHPGFQKAALPPLSRPFPSIR